MTPLKLKLGRAVPDSPIPPLSTNAANSSKSYNSRQDWNTHWKIRGELKIDHDRMTRQAMHGRFSGVVWTLDQIWDLGPTLVLGCGVDTGPDLRPWPYVDSPVWCGHWTRPETLALRWFSGVVWTLDQTWHLGPTLVLGCGVDTGPDLRPWPYVGSRVWCGHWTRSETLALRWFSGVVWALDQIWDLGPTLVLGCGVGTGPDLRPWPYVGSRVWCGHWTRPDTLALHWFSGVVWAPDQTWDLGPTLVLGCGVGTGPDLRPWPYIGSRVWCGHWTRPETLALRCYHWSLYRRMNCRGVYSRVLNSNFHCVCNLQMHTVNNFYSFVDRCSYCWMIQTLIR